MKRNPSIPPAEDMTLSDCLAALTPKQTLFSEHYSGSHNATKAALHAGYSARTAAKIGSENLQKPHIKRFVRILRDEIASQLQQTPKDLIAYWTAIVVADPTEVVEFRRGACRYCHGINHHVYQWRTQQEFDLALTAHGSLPEKKRDAIKPPDADGGFGYSLALSPHPDCPMCDGMGRGYQYIHDTANLSPQGRALFRGIVKTKDGMKVLLADKDKALEQLSKIYGIYDQPDSGETVTAIGKWLNEIGARGSKPPVKDQDDV